MNINNVGISEPLSRSRTLPGIVFFLVNFVILLSVVPLSSLALFFVITSLLLQAKRLVEERERKAYLTIAIVVLLLTLSYYHSGSHIVQSSSPIGRFLDKAAIPGLEFIRIPHLLSNIGVSYCFLRAVYALMLPQLDMWGFTRYYFFAPTFFSGPIMHPEEYLSQTPEFLTSNFRPGLTRIMLGAFKISLSQIIQGFIPLTSADTLTEQVHTLSGINAWGFTFAAGIWLYLNFSGFSDVCIGAAKLCGVVVPENFNNPFVASNLTDFWRRWHMTLAAWLRACIYTPITRVLAKHLGQRHILFLLVPPLATMLICGLWHGTAGGYFIWGLLHGIGLVIHSLYKSYVVQRLSARLRSSFIYVAAAWLLTQSYIAMTWVFFFPSPNPSFKISLLYLSRMFGISN